MAGNIAAPSQIGSIEFAAANFGCPLVLVLGHSRCGAVKATLDAMQQNTGSPSPSLAKIVERIVPALEPLVAQEDDSPDLLEHAIRANVHACVEALLENSEIIAALAAEGSLRVIGAQYALETGQVEFFG